MKEFGLVADLNAGSFVNKVDFIEVSAITASTTTLLSSTSLTFTFSIPDADVMNAANYIAVNLPNYWGNSPAMMDKSASISASLT